MGGMEETSREQRPRTADPPGANEQVPHAGIQQKIAPTYTQQGGGHGDIISPLLVHFRVPALRRGGFPRRWRLKHQGRCAGGADGPGTCRECSMMEVGQVMQVVGPPAPAPDLGETYCVPADASGRRLGAVLPQRVGDVDRPVLYISRKLSDREARYSTVERECLAIRWAVGALRYYLLGRAFSLCSDHKPLQWPHRMKDANARITGGIWHYSPTTSGWSTGRVRRWPWPTSSLPPLWGGVGGSGRGRTAARPESSGGGMWRGAWFTRSLRAGCVQGPAIKRQTAASETMRGWCGLENTRATPRERR
ncbi:uncharacterized protein [Nerophis lumbriciformis]|uniref:uncharacterized protein n=1 Tax=Nerophis lumbriciformis TaxID=546530 RepID=UPI002ADFC2B6|nr:uncharacterized protein LOC133615171 [Nerophis lumbriciformis]